MEVDFDMMTNITETLTWIDYEEVFAKLEERGIEKGKTEGKEIGRAEGQKEQALAIAKNLLGMGEPIEKVAKATGLSLEEIKSE